MPSIESALVVLVPEAEALVKPFRDRYDPSAAVGVPAHITLLYPFKPPDEVDGAVLDKLCHGSRALRRFGSHSPRSAASPPKCSTWRPSPTSRSVG